MNQEELVLELPRKIVIENNFFNGFFTCYLAVGILVATLEYMLHRDSLHSSFGILYFYFCIIIFPVVIYLNYSVMKSEGVYE